MVEFKKGDRVIVVGNEAKFGSTKEERNGVGVITDLPDREGYYGVTLNTGYYVAARHENILYYVEITLNATPPKKITQNGYEYSLVGPVKPEWLVDGVWVVGKEYGSLWQIIEGERGNFSLRDSLGNLHSKEISTIVNYYRPHTASDWKWGDWAMYEGKRVFVIERGNCKGDIRVSHPDLPAIVTYVPVLQLTPTF